MSVLRIRKNGVETEYHFQDRMRLDEALSAAGFPMAHPCGGRGTCGKCAVKVTGALSEADATERALGLPAGLRLACRTMLLGDATLELSSAGNLQIQTAGSGTLAAADPMPGKYGIAVDIGTTTVAAKLLDLESGQELASSARINPQTTVAADVMGRIGAALDGKLPSLQKQILDAITEMTEKVIANAEMTGEVIVNAGSRADAAVITGNTTMLYLLTGRSPETLSHFPFEADCLFGCETEIAGIPAYLPACMNAFVGADITCAVLASGMTEKEETALLCDIGTNGELALWKNGKLYVTSTAAGPAFEGAGISCGCGSIPGAIDKAWVEYGMNDSAQCGNIAKDSASAGSIAKDSASAGNIANDGASTGKIAIHTIKNAAPAGICGSGLIDLIAAGLETGIIDETGAMEEDAIELSGGICLLPKDVRAVQLAKAAIAAGIQTLAKVSGTEYKEIGTLYIAGGFGSHLDAASAVKIGLLPKELESKVSVIGNAALTGAEMMLLDRGVIRQSLALVEKSEHVNLGGNPDFNENYMDNMMF